MKLINKLSVGLVRPPIRGHESRGSGVYYRNLVSEFQKISEIDLSEINLSSPFSGYDIIHFPYFDPFFITLPLLGKSVSVPSVVTVHDLIPLKYPSKFPVGIKGLFKWHLQRNSLCRSASIITDTFAWKPQIAKIVNYKESDIYPIHLGVSSQFKKITSRAQLDEIARKYGLSGEFILYVGDLNYNKNIGNLLLAFRDLTSKYKNLKLILVGNGFLADSIELERVEAFIGKNSLGNKIIRLKGLTDQELSAVYNLARAVLLPSYDEGFGLPVLEAFAAQTPVIASRIDTTVEIAGDAAALFDPSKPYEIAQVASQVLDDTSLRQKLISRGQLRSKQYTWKKTALNTFMLYKKVLGINGFNSNL